MMPEQANLHSATSEQDPTNASHNRYRYNSDGSDNDTNQCSFPPYARHEVRSNYG